MYANRHENYIYDSSPEGKILERTVNFISHEPYTVNTASSIYRYMDEYKKKGIDILDYYEKHAVTKDQNKIHERFVNNKENGNISKLSETLPLLANKDGRLGEYIKARISKTIKQDDQGNSFIDLVVEINNDWIGEKGSNVDIPKKMTMLVDVTSDLGDRLNNKLYSLKKEFLDPVRKAKVMCYISPDGTLGIERPKIIVAKEQDYTEKVGLHLGELITEHASDSFRVKDERKFNEAYREYFKDFMEGIAESAEANRSYLLTKYNDSDHIKLANEYKKIADFAKEYKKTPVRRDSSSRQTGGSSPHRL